MTAVELLDEPVTYSVETDLPKGYELIDGELEEMPEMSFEASWVASRVYGRLDRWCEEHAVGVAVTAEASYACFRHSEKQVRKPDVSVIVCDPRTFIPPRPHCKTVPALIVEAVSPSNDWTDLTAKLDEFLDAGTKLAWIIDPERRVAYIQRLSDRDKFHKIREDGVLDGEDVLPGFTLPLASILPPKAAS